LSVKFAFSRHGYRRYTFAVAVRIILLPIDLIGERSDEEKANLTQGQKVKKSDF
jgi:hypothetical protein